MGKFNVITRLAGAVVLLAAAQSFAAGGAALEHANIDPGNIASLQRGARNFMNYCSGCHSAKYVRYNTIGKDLELSEEQLIENLMFNAEKTFEAIEVSMPEAAAGRWFGVAPPDLSLIGRAKGADYIYSFLKGFYVQSESPTGVDNTVLAGTSMPHVLWELQGFQRAEFAEHTEDGVTTRHFEGFEAVTDGSLDAEGFDEFVRDTVNFLVYIAEPIRSERRTLGVWVLMYLIFFWIIAVMLKKQIWKDVN
ncbi:MAG: cytochrome c1 [Gammaproteobacteria bacterium]|jgi:ubiquinol-cytochrome c reductase cytochrome c1 subunit|nr:cytochrome c1 [Gammaproteobacteria bacterium]MDH3848154.1 cytochrome c1 [Gammaproteobacteria bacterium]MDH3863442.1 cytochrome c1 [Gammaproteobacteria bacterium]MDH3904925.1 cytochrome c1 [Gammaproteobacteria bacterium]MDH3907532.1 cytochrome c1 [Gammaproteobacteria bacterium]